MSTTKSHRFMELEGLRGIAAVIVAIYHNLLAFYAVAFFGIGAAIAPVQHMRFEDNFYGTPLTTLFSGTLAVAIFFVLSGFVLSIGFFQTGKSRIIKSLAIKRYPRLMLPALASILLCFVLIVLGLSHTQAAASLTHSGWLANNWGFTANLGDAIWGGVVDIFKGGGNIYNNVLWTMATEFMGSFIVFGFLLLVGRTRYRWIGYAALFIFFFNTWFLGFVIGMMIADLYTSGSIVRAKRNTLVLIGLLGLVLFFGGYPYGSEAGTVYQFVTLPPSLGINHLMVFTTIAATIAVFTVLWATQIGATLGKKHFSILGKYTFSLYLVHLAVLYTFTTGIFVMLQSHIGYNKAAILSMLLSIPLVWLATVLFEKYVDSPSIKLASRISALYFAEEKVNYRTWMTWIQTRWQLMIRKINFNRRYASTQLEDGEIV